MEVEILKKRRSVARRLLTTAIRNLNDEIVAYNDSKSVETIRTRYEWAKSKAEELFAIEEEEQMRQYLFGLEEAEITKEIDTIESYKYNWLEASIKYEEVIAKKNKRDEEDWSNSNSTTNDKKRKFVLPKIELYKFDGNVRNWLGFWGQFKKIDEDESIDEDDKYQYLLQATTPGSPARDLVESFPPSGINYKNAVAMMKKRFARDDLLIETYVRELLKLVLNRNQTESIRIIHDKLLTQIQALETLGVTKEKYAAMLYPMVESTLPVDILRAWERYQPTEKDEDRLANLLKFLAREVDSEERIALSRDGFSDPNLSVSNQPTAACIVSSVKRNIEKDKVVCCIWCEKHHLSTECFKASKFTLEEKKEVLKKKNACYICLCKGHSAFKCRKTVKCLVCSRRHAVIMCPQIYKSEDTQKENNNETSSKQEVLLSHPNNVTLLPTLIVKVFNGEKSIKVRALIDTGSQRSYLTQEVIKQLKIKKSGEETLSHSLFGGTQTKQHVYKSCNIIVSDISENTKLHMDVLEQEKICGILPKINSTDILQKLKAKNIMITDREDAETEVKLLIGSDHYGAIMGNQKISFGEKLVAYETKLGWTLQGPMSSSQQQVTTSLHIAELWDLETIGIKDPEAIQTSKMGEQQAMNIFKNTVKKNEEGRFEVNLLWKDGRPELQNNRNLAVKRLMATTEKLKVTNKLEDYHKTFEDWERQGIIERIEEKEERGFYLPHHAVIKENSTTKVRPVFDASAKDSNGISVNNSLDKGSNLLEIIPKLLLQFRKKAIGISADIQKAFLQISLSKEDRNYFKFLWWNCPARGDEVIVFRHCRVVFGVTCSPFLLSATILHILEGAPLTLQRTAETLKHSFYVDNCLHSVESLDEAKKFEEEAKQLMEIGKFNLRDWVKAPTAENKEGTVSILGLLWDTQEDTLRCNSGNLEIKEHEKITKRLILGYAQKIYDPIGICSAVALVPKLLLQEVFKLKLSWDETVPKEIEKSFRSWVKTLNYIQDCRIPRRLTNETMSECTLSIHTFCDASISAYAACMFLRGVAPDGIVTVRLIAAKSRVSPPRKVTIPRLELLATVIGVRLYRELGKSLNVNENYFWTDSSVALTWIKKEAPWNVFVKNRVTEVREVTNLEDWHHIPGTQNPADVLSGGCTAKTLKESRWWEGPSWLQKPSNLWPRSEFIVNESEVQVEMRKTVICQLVKEEDNILQKLSYFSKFAKIVRTVGWIFRFVRNCQKKPTTRGELTSEEYIEAERRLLKLIQKESKEELNNLNRKKGNLHVFEDKDGSIRIKSKLTYREDIPEFKSPLLLPGKQDIIHRLVRDLHIELQHAGTQTLITKLRERFWIVGVRKLSKRVVSDCKICKRYKSKPVQPPVAPLPEDRVKDAKTFQITGIDMAGPLILKSGEKCWIALFTCAVYRAVHLELCLSMSTDCFLMALRRFIARRGRPQVIYTDNGSNFIGTYNRLQEVDWNKIMEFSSVKRIKWNFNPPSAPWWGGWWERIIRLLKEMLRRILGQARLNFDELETIITDCEATINARPLTYLADHSENLVPITPACFLQDVSNTETPDLDKIDQDSMNSRIKYLIKMREDFRNRFRSEYLSELVQRGKLRQGVVNVGDIVLVETEEKRCLWPLGIIIEIFPGKDNIPRVARIRTACGEKIRPFQRLYPLEISTQDNITEYSKKEEPEKSEHSNKEDPEKSEEVQTRKGRIVKIPKRLDL